ncbi:MAG TPA: hypothetical protein VNG13_13405 [Mycobacteriales bacterium]|nr:hypothetical protein [Mycobacteriales bacterium]
MAAMRSGTEWKTPRRMALSVMSRNQRSTKLSQELEVVPRLTAVLQQAHRQLPRPLRRPRLIGMCGDPDQANLAGTDLDREQHVQRLEQHHFNSEEVGSQDPGRLRPQERPPRA